jgi:hypothetical protein
MQRALIICFIEAIGFVLLGFSDARAEQVPGNISSEMRPNALRMKGSAAKQPLAVADKGNSAATDNGTGCIPKDEDKKFILG